MSSNVFKVRRSKRTMAGGATPYRPGSGYTSNYYGQTDFQRCCYTKKVKCPGSSELIFEVTERNGTPLICFRNWHGKQYLSLLQAEFEDIVGGLDSIRGFFKECNKVVKESYQKSDVVLQVDPEPTVLPKSSFHLKQEKKREETLEKARVAAAIESAGSMDEEEEIDVDNI